MACSGRACATRATSRRRFWGRAWPPTLSSSGWTTKSRCYLSAAGPSPSMALVRHAFLLEGLAASGCVAPSDRSWYYVTTDWVTACDAVGPCGRCRVRATRRATPLARLSSAVLGGDIPPLGLGGLGGRVLCRGVGVLHPPMQLGVTQIVHG